MKVLVVFVLISACVLADPLWGYDGYGDDGYGYNGYDSYPRSGSEAHADSKNRRFGIDTPFGEFAFFDQSSNAEADSYSYN